MQGFTPRDYVVSAVIITGVLVAWFLVVAGLMNLLDPKAALPLAIIIGLATYLFAKHQHPKPKP